MSAQNFDAFTQFIPKTLGETEERWLDDFLTNLNYNIIGLLPFNNNPHVIATQARNGARIRILEGKDLLKWNIKLEAQRLQLYNRYVINSATDKIWNSRYTHSQREQLDSLAKSANNINQNVRRVNDDTLNRISQINIPQVTNNPLFDDFYNGVNFSNNNNNDLESLILPAGFYDPN